MKIKKVILNEKNTDLKSIPNCNLGRIVVLAGSNGSGKTRLIKLLTTIFYQKNQSDHEIEVYYDEDDEENSPPQKLSYSTKEIKIVNLSHYDAVLQIPKDFPPHVIHQAKSFLCDCNYEETALNSLLWIYDLACTSVKCQNAKKQFEEFQTLIKKRFDMDLTVDYNSKQYIVKICGQDINFSNLSPGQQYLLRIAVACFLNQQTENVIIFMDEPELHLHPSAAINALKYMFEVFPKSQFWIATHSLSLIAFLSSTYNDTTVLNMVNGTPKLFRSDSEALLTGLLGNEENRISTQELLARPLEYACNKFAVECDNPPKTIGAQPGDLQNELIRTILTEGDCVVDYGAGKGRFIEGLGLDAPELAHQITYYAFDPENKDSKICMRNMEQVSISSKNYTNSIDKLLETVQKTADYVLLVNVLHEIDPRLWAEVFSNIYNLLKPSGKLLIVEREELTIGEMPYQNGFLVITEGAAKVLFGNNTIKTSRKRMVVKYTIDECCLKDIDIKKVISGINEIKENSLKKIQEHRIYLTKSQEQSSNSANHLPEYKKGLAASFWLFQYANSSLILKDFASRGVI